MAPAPPPPSPVDTWSDYDVSSSVFSEATPAHSSPVDCRTVDRHSSAAFDTAAFSSFPSQTPDESVADLLRIRIEYDQGEIERLEKFLKLTQARREAVLSTIRYCQDMLLLIQAQFVQQHADKSPRFENSEEAYSVEEAPTKGHARYDSGIGGQDEGFNGTE